MERIEGVTDIESPLDSAAPFQDGRSVLVDFALTGSEEHVEKLVEQPLAAVAAVQPAHPDVRVEQFGEVSAPRRSRRRTRRTASSRS